MALFNLCNFQPAEQSSIIISLLVGIGCSFAMSHELMDVPVAVAVHTGIVVPAIVGPVAHDDVEALPTVNAVTVPASSIVEIVVNINISPLETEQDVDPDSILRAQRWQKFFSACKYTWIILFFILLFCYWLYDWGII